MHKLILFGIAGFIAQLVDGSIGMGYGLTSSSMLLALGITPAVASASIHFAELATTAASGASHYRFGNVDMGLLKRMTLPGAIGAFIGACFLSSIPGDAIKPFVSVFLLVLGAYVIATFLFSMAPARSAKPLPRWKLIPLSLVAGFFDSVGGGGWGPISTPVLLSHRGMDARKVVGSVDASEFAVTAAGTLGFVIALGLHDINWIWVGIFAVSGLFAAPIAAWVVRLMPADILGVVVGGAIVLTNANTILGTTDLAPSIAQITLGIGLVVWLALIGFAIRQRNRMLGAAS